MSKKKATDNYRRQYSAKLRSSIRSFRPVIVKKSHRIRLLLLAVLTIAILACLAILPTFYGETSASKTSTTSGQPASTLTGSVRVVDLPYNHVIGFIGDSLTVGCCENSSPAPELEMELLGGDYRAINRAINGTTTRDWVGDVLVAATEEFRNNDVEIVQIMLGTNDVSQNIPIEESVENYRVIIGRLKEVGIKVIVINKIPYSMDRDDVHVRQLNAALDNLVNENGVYIGDVEAYDYFRYHQDMIYDGVHLTQSGYRELAKLWAEGLMRVLDGSKAAKINLLNTKYQRDSDKDLVFAVNRSPHWLIPYVAGGGIFIDGEMAVPTNYEVVSYDDQATTIELKNNYLNSLEVGKHTLLVKFADGVKVECEFEITD